MLRSNPVDTNLLVGKVQINPLQVGLGIATVAKRCTVGYNTLELILLSTGRNVCERSYQCQRPHTSTQNNDVSRILGLCCGCGMQGIYGAAIIATTKFPVAVDFNDSLELVLIDFINGLASGIH